MLTPLDLCPKRLYNVDLARLPGRGEPPTDRAGDFSMQYAEPLPPLPAHAVFPLPGRRRRRVCVTPGTRIPVITIDRFNTAV